MTFPEWLDIQYRRPEDRSDEVRDGRSRMGLDIRDEFWDRKRKYYIVKFTLKMITKAMHNHNGCASHFYYRQKHRETLIFDINYSSDFKTASMNGVNFLRPA